MARTRVGALIRTTVPVWLLAAGIVAIGWVLGVAVFATTAAAESASDIRLSTRDALFPVLIWLPIAAAAAGLRVLLRPSEWGTSLLVLASFVLAGGAFLSAWGGFCVSSRDQCVVVPEGHLSHLLVPVAILVAGGIIEFGLRLRRTEPAPTVVT